MALVTSSEHCVPGSHCFVTCLIVSPEAGTLYSTWSIGRGFGIAEQIKPLGSKVRGQLLNGNPSSVYDSLRGG